MGESPPPPHVDPVCRTLETNGLPAWRTVRDAIADLPLDPTGQDLHVGRNPTPMSLRRYACIPAGGNRWNLPADLTPPCWKRKTKGGTDLFGRLWWDRPSVTIRTEFYKPEKGRYLHPQADRPIAGARRRLRGRLDPHARGRGVAGVEDQDRRAEPAVRPRHHGRGQA